MPGDWIRRRWFGCLVALVIVTGLLHFWWDVIAEERLPGPTEGTRRKLAAVIAVTSALIYFGLVPFGSLLSKKRCAPDVEREPIGAWLLRWLRFMPPRGTAIRKPGPDGER